MCNDGVSSHLRGGPKDPRLRVSHILDLRLSFPESYNSLIGPLTGSLKDLLRDGFELELVTRSPSPRYFSRVVLVSDPLPFFIPSNTRHFQTKSLSPPETIPLRK